MKCPARKVAYKTITIKVMIIAIRVYKRINSSDDYSYFMYDT
jgi:hypothetical protein